MNQLELFGFTCTGLESTGGTVVKKTIPNPEKRKPGRHPQKGWTPTIEIETLEGTTRPKKFCISGSISAYKRLMTEPATYQMPSNKVNVAEHLLDDRAQWRGGTMAELLDGLDGKMNLESYQITRDELASQPWVESLIMAAECQRPRRTKVFGDSGQWVESRRYEPEPFESFTRVATDAKTLNLLIETGGHCGVNPESIQKFGAVCWALVDILETSGVSVGVKVQSRANNPSDTCSEAIVAVDVKSSGEYLSPAILAAVLTPNFFRRAVFTARTLACDVRKEEIHYSLGRTAEPEPATYREGTLKISINDAYNLDNLGKLIVSQVIEAGRHAAA